MFKDQSLLNILKNELRTSNYNSKKQKVKDYSVPMGKLGHLSLTESMILKISSILGSTAVKVRPSLSSTLTVRECACINLVTWQFKIARLTSSQAPA
ncbi:TPA: hypothetical protein DCL28_01740 [Candidatus Komeilibacteria bacterium]|nr:MAG: hypothetical protein A2260_00875 [Candidatus Komeilibacteria bacterium RIFOXYA2_FULL_45_9]HAH04263.1 hypothetical protein [Candidatus Komeilibacteria bacterium]